MVAVIVLTNKVTYNRCLEITFDEHVSLRVVSMMDRAGLHHVQGRWGWGPTTFTEQGPHIC